jgi:serine/threonine-protein kinase PpkA
LVRDHLNSGELDMADQAMMAALLRFPDLADSPEYQELKAFIPLQRRHNEQFLLAEQYFQQDKLMAPAGKNAREVYEEILDVSPENSRAQAGLEKIAARYHQLAMAARQRGDYAKAMTLVSRGLSINDDDVALSALKDELKAQINLQQYIAELLAEADKFKSQGIWFAAQNSAAQRYLQVLSFQSGQSRAMEGLQQMVDELLRQVEVQLELHNLDDASGLLAPALELMPDNPALMTMSARLVASQPRVSELEFSGVQDFTELQDFSRVKAGRTLYIRFRYSNFNPNTTVLKAVLFDGSRSVQIAAVPVIVNGTKGSSTFRIDRSVEGFKEGGYHMDMMLEGKRIATQNFIVARYE